MVMSPVCVQLQVRSASRKSIDGYQVNINVQYRSVTKRDSVTIVMGAFSISN